jgi:hypothetical protein
MKPKPRRGPSVAHLVNLLQESPAGRAKLRAIQAQFGLSVSGLKSCELPQYKDQLLIAAGWSDTDG